MSEWGKWINWNHRSATAEKAGTYVQAQSPAYQEYIGYVVDDSPYAWSTVKRYRVRKPKGLTILESILNDLPAPTKPTVPA